MVHVSLPLCMFGNLWMLDIVSFTFWGAGYFIPVNLSELRTGKQYLETI